MKSKKIKIPVLKLGVKKKATTLLWSLLVFSLVFAIFKNFTAINKHTVHEVQTIEQKVVDTNKIESFVENFVKVYYSWEQSQTALDNRTELLKQYLTEELQNLNSQMIRNDIPTTSQLESFQIWEVTKINENEFSVLYSINQLVIEDDASRIVSSSYEVKLHVDEKGDMIIIKNPTISTTPTKSTYAPKPIEPDGTVDATMTNEINEFLTTFFKLYPTATESELTYYVSNNVLKTINKNYIFIELVNPVHIQTDSKVSVYVSVNYLDDETKTIQTSQFQLQLQKTSNWTITNSK